MEERRRASVDAADAPSGPRAGVLVRTMRSMRHGVLEETAFKQVTGLDLHDERHITLRHRMRLRQWRAEQQSLHLWTWRLELARILESHASHLTVLLLIVLDILAVVAEIMLSRVCAEPAADDAGGAKRVEHWEAGLRWFSFAILVALLAQQCLLLLAFGLRYFTKVWYVIDLVVLIVALVLELVLHDTEGGLLAILLSWRLVRIVHGVLTTAEVDHSQYEQAHAHIHELQTQLLEERDYDHTLARFYAYKWLGRRRSKGGSGSGSGSGSGRTSPQPPPAHAAATTAATTATATELAGAADIRHDAASPFVGVVP